MPEYNKINKNELPRSKSTKKTTQINKSELPRSKSRNQLINKTELAQTKSPKLYNVDSNSATLNVQNESYDDNYYKQSSYQPSYNSYSGDYDVLNILLGVFTVVQVILGVILYFDGSILLQILAGIVLPLIIGSITYYYYLEWDYDLTTITAISIPLITLIIFGIFGHLHFPILLISLSAIIIIELVISLIGFLDDLQYINSILIVVLGYLILYILEILDITFIMTADAYLIIASLFTIGYSILTVASYEWDKSMSYISIISTLAIILSYHYMEYSQSIFIVLLFFNAITYDLDFNNEQIFDVIRWGLSIMAVLYVYDSLIYIEQAAVKDFLSSYRVLIFAGVITLNVLFDSPVIRVIVMILAVSGIIFL